MEKKSLVGYSPWGHKESDMTKNTHTHITLFRELKKPTVYLKPSKYKPSIGVDLQAACFHMWHFYVLCWDFFLDWIGRYYA